MIFTNINHETMVISFKCDKDEFEYFLSDRDNFNLFKDCRECTEKKQLQNTIIKVMLQRDRLRECNNCDTNKDYDCGECVDKNKWKIKAEELKEVDID